MVICYSEKPCFITTVVSLQLEWGLVISHYYIWRLAFLPGVLMELSKISRLWRSSVPLTEMAALKGKLAATKRLLQLISSHTQVILCKSLCCSISCCRLSSLFKVLYSQSYLQWPIASSGSADFLKTADVHQDRCQQQARSSTLGTYGLKHTQSAVLLSLIKLCLSALYFWPLCVFGKELGITSIY